MSQAILHPLNLPIGTEQRKKTTTTLSLFVGTLLLIGGLYGLFLPSMSGLLMITAGASLSFYWYTANTRASFRTYWVFGIVYAGLALAGLLGFAELTQKDHALHGIIAAVLFVGAYDWHHTHLRRIF